jgi:undecaprenyl-diphosphatase
MTIIEAVVVGLAHGLTEFLPVSSSGHLVILQRAFGITGDTVLFDIVLHLGTLGAVCAVFYKDIFAAVAHPLSEKTRYLALATVPAIVIALIFQRFIKDSFGGEYVGFGFLISAAVLAAAGAVSARKIRSGASETRGINNVVDKSINLKRAAIMGLFQGLAVLPGVSRSGMTVGAGLIAGAERAEAARFSFLMSIPITLAAAAHESLPLITGGAVPSASPLNLALGCAAAAVSGFFAVKYMLKLIEKSRFCGFSVYLALLGAFCLLNEYVFFLF